MSTLKKAKNSRNDLVLGLNGKPKVEIRPTDCTKLIVISHDSALVMSTLMNGKMRMTSRIADTNERTLESEHVLHRPWERPYSHWSPSHCVSHSVHIWLPSR